MRNYGHHRKSASLSHDVPPSRSSMLRARVTCQAGVGPTRDSLGVWLETHLADMPASRRSDVLLAASELLTNGLEHGSDGECSVALRRVDSRLMLTATNQADEPIPPPSKWVMPSAASRRGRGLALVKKLANDVRLHINGAAISVTAVFDILPVHDRTAQHAVSMAL